jgi:hypothetical protein
MVGLVAADQRVVALFTVEDIAAVGARSASVQVIVAVAAVQGVRILLAVEVVIPLAAVQRVVD